MYKVLLALLGVLMVFPSFAQDFEFEYEGQTLKYTVLNEEDKTCEIAARADHYDNVSGDLKIPEIANGYMVTSIGYGVFSGCSGLTSVEIPNSVTSIGESAFQYCKGLTSVEIPNSVTSIGYCVFSGCSGLTSVEIPNSVTSIGESAFQYCKGLTSVEIPNSVTSINGSAFIGCSYLTDINVGDGNKNYCSVNGTVFSKDKTSLIICPAGKAGDFSIPNSVTSIGRSAFESCGGLTSVEIPNSVTKIGDVAFSNCGRLTSVEIPNSVTTIGNLAFFGCNGLTSVEIPNSVTKIGGNVFNGCENIAYVLYKTDKPRECDSNIFSEKVYKSAVLFTYPNKIESVSPWNKFSNVQDLITGYTYKEQTVNYYLYDGYPNFSYCTNPGTNYNSGNDIIGDLAIPATIPTYFGKYTTVSGIGDYSFYNNARLLSVELPNTISFIGNSAFGGCKRLTSVKIPNSVTSIGSSAFQSCSGLTSVEISNSVTYIGGSAFNGCSGLTSVEIPNSVTYIGNGAFQSCRGLTSVEIPNSVTYIGNGAFQSCSGLTSVEISNSVSVFGEKVFSGCDRLKQVRVSYDVPVEGDSKMFSNVVYDEATLYIPQGLKAEYRKVYPWKNFLYIQEYEVSGVEDIVGEASSPVEVYNLNGVRVADKTAGLVPGIYVVRQGNTVKKIVVK